MLVLVICGFLGVGTLLLLGATYLESSKAEYPPGLENPSVIRMIHQISTALSILGNALEKLGIWSEIGLLRFTIKLQRRKLGEDPELVIKNSEFEGVPVRIYQPRAPSAKGRKGVMFFHGGGLVLGNIAPPGRPIVSGNGGPLEKTARFVDEKLKPLVRLRPSFVLDSSDLLRKLQYVSMEENWLLASVDVESLYTSIPHTVGLRAVEETLEALGSGDAAYNKFVVDMLEFVLTNNFFKFNGKSYDYLCRHISKKCGAVVVSVEYRLAPEHRYPAAHDDCLCASVHFLRTTEQYGVDSSSVIICGDSAGGSVAACVTHALVSRKDIPKPLAQVLIYPPVHMIDYNLPSYQQNSMVPLLLLDRTIFYKLTYLGANLSISKDMQNGSHVPPEFRKKVSKWLSADNIPDEFKVRGYKPHTMATFNNEVYQELKPGLDVTCCPLIAEDSVISQLPKSYLLTCEFDVFRDDGILYKKRLEDNGVSVTWHHVKNGFHGVLNFFDVSNFNSGKEAMDILTDFIKDA
ncbi:arylacetamide deacetylase-like 4 [Gastrophryne carolinensis]